MIDSYLSPKGFRKGRAILGLTAGELSKLFGVRENTIYRKESGQSVIRRSDALAMSMLILIRQDREIQKGDRVDSEIK